MARYLHFLTIFSYVRIATSLFHIFDFLDPSSIEEVYGISSRCRNALNSTINCDAKIAGRLGDDIHMDYWSEMDMTTLCVPTCSNSIVSWLISVRKDCGNDNIQVLETVLKPEAIPLIYLTNYQMACLKDSKKNWCFYESQNWQGSDYIRWDEEACDNVDEKDNPPQCKDPNFSIMDISEDMSDITNLYERTLYCSECFLLIWREKLQAINVSPSLEHTKYLMKQHDKLQVACSTKLPVALFTSTLVIQERSAVSTTLPATSTTSASVAGCFGQFVKPPLAPMSCDELSHMYNVTTGDLTVITGSVDCNFDAPICLPKPCALETVWNSPTCDTLAKKFSTSSKNVTANMLLSWNKNLMGRCDFVGNGQSICKSPPGGPAPIPSPILASTGPTAHSTIAVPPSPTQPGTIANCAKYHQVVLGDTCSIIAQKYGITLNQFKALNPKLDSACSVWLDYSVCVAQLSGGQMPSPLTGTCKVGNCHFVETPSSIVGRCGPDFDNIICKEAGYGNCCSTSGWCGDTSDHCGLELCFSGDCEPDIGGLSITGECGPTFAGNKTCAGTQFGVCCSIAGRCGSGEDFCGKDICISGECN